MAIKGKKRSRNRGSQGIRRPAAAPRPTVGGGRKGQEWYRSPLNVGVVTIFGLVAIGILIALIVDIRSRASDTAEVRSVLESYSEDVRGPLELAASPASQMGLLPAVPRGEALETLTQDAEGWAAELQEAQTQLAQIFPAPETQGVNQLFNESLALYISAANTFGTLPDISEREVRLEVFNQAATVRDTATAVFESAINILDQLRDDVDLGSSGLRAPVTSGQLPATEPEAGTEAPGGETVVIPGEEEGAGNGSGQRQEGDAEGGTGGG